MEIFPILSIVELLKYFVFYNIVTFLWRKRESIPIFLVTIRRDVLLLFALYYKILFKWMGRKRRNETICWSLDKMVQDGGSNRPCFYFGDKIWTYKQVQSMSFRVANYFQKKGLQKGDAVGLAMTSRPEAAAIWIVLGRIGVVSVLINTNLRGDSLEKFVSVVKCKAFIIGTELRQAFEEIWSGEGKNLLPSDVYELDRFMEDPGWKHNYVPFQQGVMPTYDLAQSLLNSRDVVPCGEKPNFLDPILYVFTSGTTGVPKAVRCSHGRLFFLSSIASLVNFSSKDVCYSPAPMYHKAGLYAIVWSICFGAPTVIVVKFSATKFWQEVHLYKVTICMYVNPALEKGHALRGMFGGGGMQPEVWTGFPKRFGKNIRFLDLYGSTEGNCSMINLEGKIGSCGYIPIWLQPIHPIQLVKIDEITGEILRNEETGFAIKCKYGEPGELVGKIVDSIPMARFDGYTDREATEKKIARNVFKEGDKYFRSGDCVTRDKYGYYYFRDRIGDTFRWKGENVATTLVEGVIGRVTEMGSNIVYGVKVSGTEGSACMAAILDVYDGEFGIKRFADELKKSLPKYAMPMFIRLVNKVRGLNITGTFKFQKFQLKKDGFDMEIIEDPIFIYSTETESYKRMDLEKFKEVMKGDYRF